MVQLGWAHLATVQLPTKQMRLCVILLVILASLCCVFGPILKSFHFPEVLSVTERGKRAHQRTLN